MSDEATKNPNQHDLDSAQAALAVGATLSTLSTFAHVVVVLAYFLLTGRPSTSAAVLMAVIIPAAALGSWAVIHALLSLVVTSALTAKHTIYQSSKNQTPKTADL